MVAECPVNLEGILFVHFIGSFEPTLSGSVAKEFKFDLIIAKNHSTEMSPLFLLMFLKLLSYVQPNLAAGLMMTSH